MQTIQISVSEEDLKNLAQLSEQDIEEIAGGCNFVCGVAAGVVANFVTDGIRAASDWLSNQNSSGDSPFGYGA